MKAVGEYRGTIGGAYKKVMGPVSSDLTAPQRTQQQVRLIWQLQSAFGGKMPEALSPHTQAGRAPYFRLRQLVP